MATWRPLRGELLHATLVERAANPVYRVEGGPRLQSGSLVAGRAPQQLYPWNRRGERPQAPACRRAWSQVLSGCHLAALPYPLCCHVFAPPAAVKGLCSRQRASKRVAHDCREDALERVARPVHHSKLAEAKCPCCACALLKREALGPMDVTRGLVIHDHVRTARL